MSSRTRLENNIRRKRKTNFRPERDKILIVCEGKKTEPNYFRKFKAKIVVIDIDIHGKGFNTISLVKEAISQKEKAEKIGKPYNQIWCVFDKDSFTDNDFNSVIILAENKKIRVAYSNQSFELWYLLHFSYMHSALDRDVYCKKLGEYFGKKYEKNRLETYDEIIDKQPMAIKNAKKLMDSYSLSLPCSKKDPCTLVYLLVEELNKFIE
jgi:hypothetical protein